MSLDEPIDLRQHVIAAVVATAPDVDGEIENVGDDVDLFAEFDLDSMDRLNIMTALVSATGVEISDADYPQLTTMRRLIDHLS